MNNSTVSIAVLPFRDLGLGQDTVQPAMIEGILEDLTTELARFPALEVIAHGTALAEAHPSEPGESTARRLHAVYLVQGSVRQAGGMLRLSAQLVQQGTGKQLWAERFDVPLSDLFVIEDEIVASVASALHVRIEADRLATARRAPMKSLAAYECWLRGYDQLRRGTLESDLEARPFFEQAIQLDPQWARGYAGLSLSYFNEWSCQAWHVFQENADKSFEYAMRALDVEERDPLIHVVIGRVLLSRRRFVEAERHFDRAVLLTPNYAMILAHAALAKCFLGHHEEAIAMARKAMRLHPLHEDYYFATLGMPQLFLGHEQARTHLVKAGKAFLDLSAYRAAAAAASGDLSAAHSHRDEFLDDFKAHICYGREPEEGEALDWFLFVNPFLRDEDSHKIQELLTRVGLTRSRLASPATPRPAGLDIAGNIFHKDGTVWTVAFEGSGARLTELKGFHDIARLLARPRVSIHCLDLVGASLESNSTAGEVLDPRARGAYYERIRELQGELEEAEARNDIGRAERVSTELEMLVDTLSKAMGLGGRSRKLGDPAERSRSAVTWRIRSAIRNIQTAHPRLGSHLANAIRTGTFCVYSPETDLSWQV